MCKLVIEFFVCACPLRNTSRCPHQAYIREPEDISGYPRNPPTINNYYLRDQSDYQRCIDWEPLKGTNVYWDHCLTGRALNTRGGSDMLCGETDSEVYTRPATVKVPGICPACESKHPPTEVPSMPQASRFQFVEYWMRKHREADHSGWQREAPRVQPERQTLPTVETDKAEVEQKPETDSEFGERVRLELEEAIKDDIETESEQWHREQYEEILRQALKGGPGAKPTPKPAQESEDEDNHEGTEAEPAFLQPSDDGDVGDFFMIRRPSTFSESGVIITTGLNITGLNIREAPKADSSTNYTTAVTQPSARTGTVLQTAMAAAHMTFEIITGRDKPVSDDADDDVESEDFDSEQSEPDAADEDWVALAA
ncbi:hypothetical protein B0T26DRAFT_676935 [Lasiosphaeria miniovina]|uniref:Uncharacterized protein n=1 Tax=Lasiosphaeria miniovina TaxID=1954250 RepID=A0AA40AAW9_9PEZI|nr:uncharacterized protein B0T26DRAFT_676935 [Lasiosphaeria miniovina]KAK0712481.1 hypothetical protein B0T26DRAFT_676935 [Lasiosphaeria miniovina]